MTTPRFSPTIRTQADLAATWRTLIGRGEFGDHSLWMMWVVDGQPLPQVTELPESEEPLDGVLRDNFVEVLRLLAAGLGTQARVAFLLSRPGGSTLTAGDRGWAVMLYDAASQAGVPCETVHLATRDDVRPLPRDELGSATV